MDSRKVSGLPSPVAAPHFTPFQQIGDNEGMSLG